LRTSNAIVWEEASRVITGSPTEAPPPDVDHIVKVIEELKPAIVLTFGRIATNGTLKALSRLEGTHRVTGERAAPGFA
jgi:hypothetical protein